MKIEVEQAIQIIQSICKEREVISLPSFQCLHRVCATDIVSTMDSPPFPKSAMDGYAYHANTKYKKLKIIGTFYAGDVVDVDIQEDECIFVSTGCMLPDSVDCVIKFEDVKVDGSYIELQTSLKPYTNYIQKGEDYKKGSLLISKNTYLNPFHLSILSSCGISHIDIYKPIKVKILSTGCELNPVNQPLQNGKIFNSTYIYLYSRLNEMGIKDIDFEQIEDDKNRIQTAIQNASTYYDVLITTGGASVGPKDYIISCIQSLHGEIHFHGIHMKPGMPTAFSSLHDCDILSLSGNPFACIVAFELFFKEMLHRYMPCSYYSLHEKEAILDSLWSKPLYGPRYCKGYYEDGMVHILTQQGNGQILSMKDCNCLVRIEDNQSMKVKVFML